MPTLILLLVGFGGLIVYAKDVKLGLVFHFITFGLTTMWFYNAGWTYKNAAILMFISLILMAFTIYATSKTTKQPGGAII